MIGKSYDGTLSNGVAATGVEGLKTIVPVSAISDWYLYSRTGGVRHNTNYPGGSLNPTVTTDGNPNNPPGVNLPRRLQQGNPPTGPCADENALLNNDANSDGGDGDAHGDYQQVLERPRSRQGREQGQGRRLRDARLPGRQREDGPAGRVVGGPEGQQRAAQAVAAARRSRRSVRVAAGQLGHHPAPLVRPLALRREQRHRERAEGPRSRTRSTSGATTASGPSPARRTWTSSCARRAISPAPARSPA